MPRSSKKKRFARKIAALALVTLGPIGACEPTSIEAPEAAIPALETACGDGMMLQTTLFGAIETKVLWSGSDFECESMPRPDGEGIRLRFAGDVSGETLAFIVALPQLRAGEDELETPANVTATIEGSGRFFTTPGIESCWLDVDAQDPVPDQEQLFVLRGTLSCIAPLGEVNGDAALSIPSMQLKTMAHWGKQ